MGYDRSSHSELALNTSSPGVVQENTPPSPVRQGDPLHFLYMNSFPSFWPSLPRA